MLNSNNLKISKLKKLFNYQIWKIYMHAYLCFKKCHKTIENKKFVDKNKIVEILSHIWLHSELKFFIQTQHVINAYIIWKIFNNLYHVIEFNEEFLLCKDLFNIILIKCGNNVETYFSKIKKCIDNLHVKNCNIFFIFSTLLILMKLNDKYEFIVIVIINHIQLKKNNVFKINSNINWLYYFILNKIKCIDAQSIQNIFMIIMSSSVNFDNFNSKNKFKKNSNQSANKFCELHKINVIYIDKNRFCHNKTHFVSEYEIIVIINEHVLFSTILID